MNSVAPSVCVVCQRPLLSRIHTAGEGLTPLMYAQSSLS